MKPIHLTLLGILVLGGCGQREGQPAPGKAGDPANKAASLTEARRGFTTKLQQHEHVPQAVPNPPPPLSRAVRYDAPAGKRAAYLSPAPQDGKKPPAMIWITGGDCNTIDRGCWQEGPP